MFDWDHNAYYHRLLLRHLPQPCRRVLDVGCGAGAFAAQLAQQADHVDAIDRCAVMIEAARHHIPDNVHCVRADALGDPLPADDYDAVFSISALHQMPLQDALPRFAAALRPGGTLAMVALPRRDLPRELPIEVVATIGHRLLGATFHAARFVAGNGCFVKHSSHTTMPVVLDPPLTTREVHQQANAVVRGARTRRLVFWRYLLLWHKPNNGTR